MSEPTLFRLHLGSALRYQAFAGEADPLPSCPPADDCVWIFDPGDMVAEDPDDGPRVRHPLPQVFFSGKSSEKPCGESFNIPVGDYIFLQWRKADYPCIEDGLDEFMRQIWWEGEKTEGPWILRIVQEDDHTAYQGLRLISTR